ncbi:MmgE/PrpD family protein [Novosphingobium sp. 11B]
MTESTNPAVPIARQLAQWGLSLRLEDVPGDVLEKVKLHLLDQIGAQASCHALPTPRITQRYVTQFGRPGIASVLGTNLSLDPEDAGFANAVAGSSFEIDDYGGNGAYAHPGCVVVPGALAVAESLQASGAEFLRSVTAGFEVIMRLAVATMPSMLQERGVHQTGAHGVFGVAIASSLLHGDDAETATNALSIAGSHASGTTEYSQTGGEVKRIHAGIGVAGGLRGARLARLGISAPPTILEGRRGVLQALCNGYDITPLYEELGTRWHFHEKAALKAFASCALVHHHFAALDKIRARHAVAIDEIEEVVLGCDPLTLIHNGAAGPHPTTLVGAQFSAEYGIAMRIVRGNNSVGTYLDLQAEGFQDPAIKAIAEKVVMAADAECAAGLPMGRVTIRLRSGETLSDTGYALGSPLNPLGRGDVEDKYRELVERDFGAEATKRSLDLIMNIENVADLRTLTDIFRRD